MSQKKKAVVIGAGFAGLSAAAHLAKAGLDVTVIEKNEQAGGRARKFEQDGFTFDMGPSWYWMPEIFEAFYNHFGKKTSDFYTLKRLDPSYRIYFGENDAMDVPAGKKDLIALFEKHEKGSGAKLEKFLEEAAYKYEVGMREFVRKPGLSIFEFADIRLLKAALKLNMFNSVSSYIKRYFKNPKLIQLLEFPVLFLGAKPSKTPALYTMMNHADLNLGTWYPMGGMHEIAKAMHNIALDQGVNFHFSEEVKRLEINENKISKIHSNKASYEADIVVGAADYQHVESKLLPAKYQSYSAKYWESRTLAPSCLLFYLGVDIKIPNLKHHNLFFDSDFEQHAEEIYDNPRWPEAPLFYVCAPSKTDPSVAPKAKENLFVLIPVATKIEEAKDTREKYYHMVMDRLEKLTKTEIRSKVIYKKSYAHREFISDYNSFKGNAYGLANTLSQTAILKP
ncbi:MAG: phytoene desaturase family protein, partial [Chitinophagales bacterium]